MSVASESSATSVAAAARAPCAAYIRTPVAATPTLRRPCARVASTHPSPPCLSDTRSCWRWLHAARPRPPPPRTTSRSPLASPTSPSSPPRIDPESCPSDTNVDDDNVASRQAVLEQRHQELLKKQKALQEQYARLQMIQRSGPTLPPNAQPDLKKTGSESNLLTKMNLNLAPAAISGSMTHLAGDCKKNGTESPTIDMQGCQGSNKAESVSTTNKVYQTDIL
ncbi:hypothetical protein O3G_MSEX009523 [Manduca sexta]|uniref:Uncharacterized protein n=1 Tax=Manduca sexta TaxID=7130 RepID=A0A921ZDL3_MANSE|nr:hypothetical protein O3G_MSEX009523 [Manduca sexta]